MEVTIEKYLHHIRNMNKLDEEMIKNICIMPNDYKMKIIITLNEIVEQLAEHIQYN